MTTPLDKLFSIHNDLGNDGRYLELSDQFYVFFTELLKLQNRHYRAITDEDISGLKQLAESLALPTRYPCIGPMSFPAHYDPAQAVEAQYAFQLTSKLVANTSFWRDFDALDKDGGALDFAAGQQRYEKAWGSDYRYVLAGKHYAIGDAYFPYINQRGSDPRYEFIDEFSNPRRLGESFIKEVSLLDVFSIYDRSKDLPPSKLSRAKTFVSRVIETFTPEDWRDKALMSYLDSALKYGASTY